MNLTQNAVNHVNKFERSVMLFTSQLVRFVEKHFFKKQITQADEKQEKKQSGEAF